MGPLRRAAAPAALAVLVLLTIGQGNGEATSVHRLAAVRELVFSSDWASDLRAGDVYTVSTAGGGRKNLSRSPVDPDLDAAWSPDGKTLAFWSFHSLSTMPVAGGKATVVARTDLCCDLRSPGWTPDGELSFVGRLFDGREGLFRVGAHGGDLRLVLANVGDPAWSPDGRRVAFVRQEPGGCSRYCPAFNLYVAGADGSGVRRLTQNPAAPTGEAPKWVDGPAWSPDGASIAYVQGELGPIECTSPKVDCPDLPHELRVREADGSHDTRLLQEPGVTQLTWSRDGRLLLFRVGVKTIAVMRADGSGLRRLGSGSGSSWSPDGSRIAFVSDGRVVSMRADGSGLRVLWSSGHRRRFGVPSWSPDGRRLTVTSVLTKNDREIHRMREDGSALRTLTANAVDDRAPAVSPDRRLIAFERGSARTPAVWIMRSNGSAQRRLGPGRSPAWAPNGRHLLVVRGSDVWLVRLRDGAGRRLIRNAADPAWSPDGRSIAFGRRASRRAASLHRLDLPSGRLRRLTRVSSPDSDPSWSPDGRWIAYSSSSTLYRIGRDGGRRRELVSSSCGVAECFLRAVQPAWSPDGTRVALSGERGFPDSDVRPGLYVISAAGRVLNPYPNGAARPLRDDLAQYSDPDWMR